MAKITKSLVAASLLASSAASADVMLGAYVPGDGFSTGAIIELNSTIPKPVAFVNLFSSFSHNWDHLYWQTSNIVAEGAMPLITWMPIDLDRPDTNILGEIIEGKHDEYIDLWGAKLLAWINQYALKDKPKIMLRFGHEFNGNWYSYGNSPFYFQAAWQYIHDKFETSGANIHLEWVWSANNVSVDDYDDLTVYYPGDSFVDWTSIDGYNFGSNYSWTSWESFTDLFSDAYLTLIREYPEKPIMIAEIGSAEESDLPDPSMGQFGDNSDAHNSKELWIANFLTELESSFPAVRAISWFNNNKELGWSITQHGNTGISSYIAGVQSDHFTTDFLSAPDSSENTNAVFFIDPILELSEEVGLSEPDTAAKVIAVVAAEENSDLIEEVDLSEPDTVVKVISVVPAATNFERSEELVSSELEYPANEIAALSTEPNLELNEASLLGPSDLAASEVPVLPIEPSLELNEEFSLILDNFMCFTGTETQFVEQQAKLQSPEKLFKDDGDVRNDSHASLVRAKTSYTNALSAYNYAQTNNENTSSQYSAAAAKRASLKANYLDQLSLTKTVIEKKENALASIRELVLPLLYYKNMYSHAESNLEASASDLESAEKDSEVENLTILFDEAELEFHSARSELLKFRMEFQVAQDIYVQLEHDYDDASALSQSLLQRYNDAESQYRIARTLYFESKRQKSHSENLLIAARTDYQKAVSKYSNESAAYFDSLEKMTVRRDKQKSQSGATQTRSIEQQSGYRISDAHQNTPLFEHQSSRLTLSDPKTSKEKKDAEKVDEAYEKELKNANKVKKMKKSEQVLLAQSNKPVALDSEKLKIRKEKYKNITEQELSELKQRKLDVLNY